MHLSPPIPKVWISARCSHDGGLFLARSKCCTACRQAADLHSSFAHKIHAQELGSEKTGEARIDIDCGFFLWGVGNAPHAKTSSGSYLAAHDAVAAQLFRLIQGLV